MTRQNRIHREIREAEQLRKLIVRHSAKYKYKYSHTRKWWKAWHKTQKYKIAKMWGWS